VGVGSRDEVGVVLAGAIVPVVAREVDQYRTERRESQKVVDPIPVVVLPYLEAGCRPYREDRHHDVEA
jgi:hypothetical protein